MRLWPSLYLIQIFQRTTTSSQGQDLGKNQLAELLPATQFCFENSWRTLQSLPPSITFLETLSAPDHDLDLASMLHSLILAPRLNNRLFGAWIKDSLVKQGLKTSQAESLLKTVDANVNSFPSDVKATQKLLAKMDKTYLSVADGSVMLTPKEMPTSFELAILDAFISKLQISVDTMFSAGASGSDFLSGIASSRPGKNRDRIEDFKQSWVRLLSSR